MPEGILNLDKPRGPTSHDIVERVRELTGVRRVGHAGTLDPLATGVLVVCVGRSATRVVEYLMDELKVYRAQVRFGVTTDTYDGEGRTTAEAPVDLRRDQVQAALARFQGTIEQIPPMYSALKHKGKPLYRLARQGVDVERKPRRVEISRLELIAWQPPVCALEVECSPGTYVRTLIHDLGQVLGCGAYLTGLTRLASGDFRLEDAVTLDEFAQTAEEGRWPELLRPVDEPLAGRFPSLHLDADSALRICSGQAVPNRSGPSADLARVYGPSGRFLALAAYDGQEDTWRPHKVFASPCSSRCPRPSEASIGDPRR